MSDEGGVTTLPTALWRKFLNKVFTTHDGKRDLAKSFGYPEVISSQDYYDMYARGGIASRIIKAFPSATWAEMPEVVDENEDEDAPFSVEFEAVAKKLNLLHYLERVDRLASIGQFGVLLLGFADATDAAAMKEPLREGAENELLYMVPYLETSVKISKWVSDVSDPRFGQPELYSLSIRPPTGASAESMPQKELLVVHHSRVIHVAEELEQDEVYGVPRLRAVFNDLMDLIKVSGGSAETYWMAANRGIFFGTDADTTIDQSVVNEMKTQIDEYQHGQRRSIVGQGFTPNVLGSEVPTVSDTVDSKLKLIAGTVGTPIRILVGNEAGELASSQDENNWNSKIHERRTSFAGPRVLKPVIQKLIDTKNISAPQGEWEVKWEEASKLGEKEQADVANTKMTALKTYVSTPGMETILAPEEARIMVGMDPESDYELVDPEDLELGDGEVDPLTGLPVAPGAVPPGTNNPPPKGGGAKGAEAPPEKDPTK